MQKHPSLFDTSVYRFDCKDSIFDEKDLGICADVASLRTPEYCVSACECFQGCPYSDTGFRFHLVMNGHRYIHPTRTVWLPSALLRYGETEEFDVQSVVCVVPGTRAFVLKVTFESKLARDLIIPIKAAYRSNPSHEEMWDFLGPRPKVGKLEDYYEQNGDLFCKTESGKVRFTSSLPGMKAFFPAYLWEGELLLPAKESRIVYFSAQLGRADEEFLPVDYEEMMAASFAWIERESDRIAQTLPRFSSSEPALTNLYYRSLVTYMLCRWENPDLCAIPYFSTGSINGACMCSYLWDYCGGLMMHPLYDLKGNKENLKAYLRNDLTTSYALNPVTSKGVGPWYPVNQEKIILMVYYHVLFTGDKEFLSEKVGDKTVIEWMLYHAYVADDTSSAASLYDYGVGGDSHLELRREYVYNGVMPDLNARRYLNYMRVYELTKVAGCPDERLRERAAALKEVLPTLWNEACRWYDFIDANGKRDIRYTVQMFKFLNSPVIGEKEREGLISHLNEEEFLSQYGLHSMSKKDEAYDQDDIDNGGGGICTHFTVQICAQLYEMGYDTLATDILRRIYWWGEKMPYMGDSCAANMMMNREDTPLQGDISSVSCAQMIFYYIFGIRADFDGNISVSPVKNRPAESMKIENARLCGTVFSVEVTGDVFSVTRGEETFKAKVGEKISFKA